MAAGRKYKCFSNRRLNSRFLFVGCGGRHRQRWGRAEVGEAGPAGTIFRALLFLSIYFFLCLARHCLPACLPAKGDFIGAICFTTFKGGRMGVGWVIRNGNEEGILLANCGDCSGAGYHYY